MKLPSWNGLRVFLCEVGVALAVILLLLSGWLFVGAVFSWEEVDVSGSWITASYDEWDSGWGGGECVLVHEQNVTNLNEWTVEVLGSGNSYWCYPFHSVDVSYCFWVNSSVSCFGVVLDWCYTIGFLSWWEARSNVYIYVNGTWVYAQYLCNIGMIDYNFVGSPKNVSFAVSFLKKNETCLAVFVGSSRTQFGTETTYCTSNYTVESGFWNCSLSREIFKYNEGYVKGWVDFEVIDSGEGKEEPSYDYTVGGGSLLFPNWLLDFFGQMGSWFSAFSGIVAPLWVMVVPYLPFLPCFVAFWVLDAVALSVKQGSFTPLGRCFGTLFDYVGRGVHVMVGIFHAVYDFIHFW